MDANDPHQREYLAAAEGMADLYGRGVPHHVVEGLDDCYGRHVRVGDWLTWRREDWPPGRTRSGRVRAIDGGRFVTVDDEGDSHVLPGEVMPF